jgi:hypothetical protein
LIQRASGERLYVRTPASTWDAILDYVHNPTDVARLANSARERLLFSYAIPLYRRAADAGDRYSALQLADLLAAGGDLDALRAQVDTADVDDNANSTILAALMMGQRGGTDALRAQAAAGNEAVSFALALKLGEQGDLDELRARSDTDRYAAMEAARQLADRGDTGEAAQLLRPWADTGAQDAGAQLADLLVKHGDLDELRRRADAGDETAVSRLASVSLAERGDLDGLAVRADSGDRSAAEALAQLLAERGDLDGLAVRADSGDRSAAEALAQLLARHGDPEGLRTRARAGDQTAATYLARLLFERDDVDGLRDLADGADPGAAPLLLAMLLVERRDLEGLLGRVAGGDHYAERPLADLLDKLGRKEDAERLRRLGLNPDGSIATS